MPRARSTRVLVWACLALVPVAVAVWGGLAIAQQPSSAGAGSAAPPPTAGSAESPAEAPAETPVPEDAKPKKEFRGRLPAYYSRVVDQKQREKIYAIQREYAPKIDALKAQLAALTAERDEKVVAVLAPEQLKTVEQLKAEAKAKRAAAKAAKSGSQ